VLGCCFAFGGFKYHEQTFNVTGAQTNCSLLTLSVLSLLLPAAFRATVPDEYHPAIIPISHGAAVTMLVVYVLFLFFELKTHNDLFVMEHEGDETENMTAAGAAALLVAVTLVVALCAEYLVGSIEGVAESAGLTKAFIGLVLLPIVGNAAEHVTAITSAMHNNIGLSIAVAVGSSIQIALFLTPAMVVFGWIIGTEFTLFFNVYETSVLFVSVMVTNSLLVDGK
ncbi:MAG: Sodium/calcium exchanger protein-domain-containing protein, partial [Olpidium bornovanus]